MMNQVDIRKRRSRKPRPRIIESDSEEEDYDDDDDDDDEHKTNAYSCIKNASQFGADADTDTDEDIGNLSKSMKRIRLVDDDDDASFSSNNSDDKQQQSKKESIRRQRLEELSWSSSEEEDDENESRGKASLISSKENNDIMKNKKISTFTLSSRSTASNGRSSSDSRTVVNTTSTSFNHSSSTEILSNYNTIRYNNNIKNTNTSTLQRNDMKKKNSTMIATKQSKSTSCVERRRYSSDASSFSISDSSLSTSSDDDDDDYIYNSGKKGYSWSFNKNREEYIIGGNDKIPPFTIPSSLFNKLYDFQKDGVAWLATLYLKRIGGILGDDMGMGKTFTTLSLLGGLMKSNTIKKAVVVAPVSVLRNWENEAKRILPLCRKVNIQVLTSTTTPNKRKKILHQVLEAHSPQLLITSFGLVASNPDHFTQQVSGKKVWDYVILDEAHKIKNPNTANYKAMEMIAKNKNIRRIILTGTPIMNNLKELHTLFNFATSGKVLGTLQEFQKKYGKPIEAARSVDADEYMVQLGEEAMQELQQLIQPYFLQRMKSEYLSEALPPKYEYVLWTNLSPLQRRMYTEYIESETVSSILGGEAKSPLFAITWLQKLCGHPLLVQGETVKSIDNFDEHEPNELMDASAKLKVMYNLVKALICNGHRTLIFSQSTKVLDIIEKILKEKFKLSRIDGKTKEIDRQKQVDEFNEAESDVNIMLISTKAGGQGLTLTGADSCVVYDPSWNPAEDAQAVDRCYRLGQKKKVQVFRLITAGTVEEKRYEKQIHKDGIRRAILTNTGNNTAKYFTNEELRKKVFILGDEGECEFLEKLELLRGFSYDPDKNPDHSHESLEGVVGQSSHDIVYSLPEDFYLDNEMIMSPSQQPFSSPPTATKWFTKNKSKSNVNENKRTNGSIKTGNAKFGSLNSLKTTFSRVENLCIAGKKEQAVRLLMDLLDNKDGNMTKSDVMKVHELISSITSELGWLGDDESN